MNGLSFDLMGGKNQTHFALCTGAYSDGALKVCIPGFYLDSMIDDGPVVGGSPNLLTFKVQNNSTNPF